MLDPFDYENRPYFRKLRRMRKLAYGVILLEQISLKIWRSLSWILGFSGLWMLGALDIFGASIQIASNIIFFIGLAYLFYRDLTQWHAPSKREIDKRIEVSNKLAIGEISFLEDKLSTSQNALETQTLWQAAQRATLHRLRFLSIPKSKPRVIRRDPYGLRVMSLMLCIIGFVFAGDLWSARLSQSLWPYGDVTGNKSVKQDLVKFWVSPPDYTQIQKFALDTKGTSNIYEIPEGSTIEIFYKAALGNTFPPKFINGDKSMTHLNALDDENYTLKIELSDGDHFAIKQGLLTPYTWHYKYIIDQPPKIWQSAEIKEKYDIQPSSEIRFPLLVQDDYSVKELSMHMQLDPMITDQPLGDNVTENRLVMSAPQSEFKIDPIYDLAWHSWSGLPVIFTFEAIDHKGQKATLNQISLTLPEKEFKHPVAKSLITMKKRLAWEYDSSFYSIGRNLESLLKAPQFLQNDPVVVLAIRTASARLIYGLSKKTSEKIAIAKEVMALLWETALRVEDGNLSRAIRELKTAQRNLENALRNPETPKDEISKLMDELREKMQNYFSEMQKEMQKRAGNNQQAPQISPEQFSQVISPDTIAKLMQDIEDALRNGDQERAQELMAQMQRMMEMMDSAGNAQLPSDMKMMQKGVNELQKLIEEQEKLYDQTHEHIQNTGRYHSRNYNQQQIEQLRRNLPSLENMLKEFGLEPPKDLKKLPERLKEPSNKNTKSHRAPPQAAEQEALRYILGQIMIEAAEKIGEVPENMGQAEQEMRLSENALGQKLFTDSLPHQSNAIEYLKDAQEQLSQMLQQRMQQMIGIGVSGAPQSRDPLGRRYDGDQNGPRAESEVEIPDDDQKKRLNDVLRELRDRSGDRSRPRDERDYLQRLLREF